MYEGQFFTNIYNRKVFDISGNKDVEGQNVHIWKRHGGANQRWRIIYSDQTTKEQTKGVHKDFGFAVNRAFYIRSRMPMKRVVEVVGSDVRLRRWHGSRVRQQTYRFDAVSKTVKSEYHKSYSLDITNNGRGNNLRVTTTNSRWW
jgi:hypothetical protein